MDIEYNAEDFTASIVDSYRSLMPAKSEALLAWRYLHHPTHRAGIIGQAFHEDELVGMTPFLPAVLKGGSFGFQPIDTFVSDKVRGQGVFVKCANKTMQAASDRSADCVFGFPNAAAAKGWYSHLGWTKMGTVPFLFRPTRTGYFVKKIFRKKILDFPIRSRRAYVSVENIDRFESWADRIWQEFSEHISCAVERDQKFLNWRLFEHPTQKYQVLGWRGEGGEIEAFVAVHVVEKHGGRIGYIMEAMARTRSLVVLPKIVEAAVNKMNGVDAILAWCFKHSPNYDAFRKSGFWPMPDAVRPHEINFGARALTPRGNIFLKPQNWYLSYLDSDTV